VTPEPFTQALAGAESASRPSTLDGSKRQSALVVEHLSKRFGDRVAFDDVSFGVGYGEVFGFLGPNGAGKTTTVRTLGTLIAPTSGSARVAGIPLSVENGQVIRARISIMPESPGLYLRLTVMENLQCFAGLYELDDVRGRIERALRAVNLVDRVGDPCGSLSKGLRQRVALARALLNDPTVLFLDEPTSGLDPVATREVHELVASLRKRGVTIFLTTHRLEEAERLCDRVAILNTTLRLIGRPDELRAQLFRRSLDVRIRARWMILRRSSVRCARSQAGSRRRVRAATRSQCQTPTAPLLWSHARWLVWAPTSSRSPSHATRSRMSTSS
jgi:ABC-2 type transport system ATP-binding protein